MDFFGRFSPRARRTIFLARSQAVLKGAQEITPEHILGALLKEDSDLLALLLPNQPNSLNEIERLLESAATTSTMKKSNGDNPLLSSSSREVVFTASQEQKRLGHKSVGTQHLLLALIVAKWKRPGWLRTRVRQNDTVAKQILEKHGLSEASVEERIKEGIVTPLTWVLDDSIIKLNAQLTAVAELLISKRIFTRTEYVAMLDQNADPVKSEIFFAPLIAALTEKGKLTAAEKEAVSALQEMSSSNPHVDEVNKPPAIANSSAQEPTKD